MYDKYINITDLQKILSYQLILKLCIEWMTYVIDFSNLNFLDWTITSVSIYNHNEMTKVKNKTL